MEEQPDDAVVEADRKATVEQFLGALRELDPVLVARLELDLGTEAQLDELVKLRAGDDLARAERRIADVRRERDQLKVEVERLRSCLSDQTIRGALRDAAASERVRPEAIADLLLHANAFEVSEDGRVQTREASGVAP